MQPNPDYRAYLLRLWRARDDSECWRASLEDAHTREFRVFAEMTSVFSFLEALTAHADEENEATQEEVTTTKHETGLPRSKATMWMSMTTLKTDPAHIAEVEAVLCECDQALPEKLRGRESYQILSADDPSTIISLTVWNSPEHQKKIMSNANYTYLIKEKLMPLLLAPPEHTAFHILTHTICETREELSS